MATTINRTAANSNGTASAYLDGTNAHVVMHLVRIGPVLIYMRFATLMFSKILLTSHPNLSDRSARYQRLVKRLIFISALMLSLLIWLVETEFMGFFLKYVIKITPKLWIFPPRVLTESFVTLKLIALNSIISKYDSLASGREEDAAVLPASARGFLSIEFSRIEDILMEFFENCELGRSGYLLVNPIRKSTSTLLASFQQFIHGGLLDKRRHLDVTHDDLATLPQLAYRSLNAKRSHSVNCIDDFKKLTRQNSLAHEFQWPLRWVPEQHQRQQREEGEDLLEFEIEE